MFINQCDRPQRCTLYGCDRSERQWLTRKLSDLRQAAILQKPRRVSSDKQCHIAIHPQQCQWIRRYGKALRTSRRPARHTTGNQSSRNFWPAIIPCPGNGGDVRPGLATTRASSPTNRRERARRRWLDRFPRAPCTVRKSNSTESPGISCHSSTRR